MKINFFTVCFLCCLSFGFKTYAQSVHTNLDLLNDQIGFAVQLYDNQINEESHLLNGAEYVPYNRPTQGHAFFLTTKSDSGSVFYDGQLYKNVALLYDIVKDVVIVHHSDPKGNYKRIVLLNNKIKYFSFLNHSFVRLESDTLRDPLIKPGLYDLLYDGSIKVYSKRYKKIYERLESGGIRAEIVSRDHYYIYKDGKFYPVMSKSSVFSVLSDKKKELRKYLRENKIDFKRNRESSIVGLAVYYNDIK